MAELEATFGCPVVEAYGMTEASHQMASNPLPPAARKPGSVGLAAGPEVAIMDEDGNVLPAGAVGEVVIRGPNVTRGYESNPEANARAFTNGWFRTGDQGRVDPDGYLFLTGRLKELINRGGEKVSPIEVDTVIMDHPAVAQVVTFAVPHPKLGEEVAAVAVLRDGMQATEAEIRAFAAARLADFKVPRRVLFVDEIPKGATGKLQRVGLAQKLGLAEAAV
jgi:acyl-CoA synthetase (AMP-forming)/AMP-acid ligase II